MKRFVSLVCMLLLCSCPLRVLCAQATYNTAGELYQAIYDDLPGYITGVWSTDGGMDRLTFGVTDDAAGRAGMEELRARVTQADTLTFVFQQHPRSYLLQVQQELEPYFYEDVGLVSTGVMEMENRVEVTVLRDRAQDTATQAMLRDILARYGDAIYLTYGDGVAVDTAALQRARQAPLAPVLYALALSTSVLLGGATAVYLGRKATGRVRK